MESDWRTDGYPSVRGGLCVELIEILHTHTRTHTHTHTKLNNRTMPTDYVEALHIKPRTWISLL